MPRSRSLSHSSASCQWNGQVPLAKGPSPFGAHASFWPQESRQVHCRSWRHQALVFLSPQSCHFGCRRSTRASQGSALTSSTRDENVVDPGWSCRRGPGRLGPGWHALGPNPNGPEAEARAKSAPAVAVTATVPVKDTRTDDERWAAIGESGRSELALREKSRALEASRRIDLGAGVLVPLGEHRSRRSGRPTLTRPARREKRRATYCDIITAPSEGDCPSVQECAEATYTFREGKLTGFLADYDIRPWEALREGAKEKLGDCQHAHLWGTAHVAIQSDFWVWELPQGELGFVMRRGVDINGRAFTHPFAIAIRSARVPLQRANLGCGPPSSHDFRLVSRRLQRPLDAVAHSSWREVFGDVAAVSSSGGEVQRRLSG